MEEFMVLAGDNTSQNLETCGVLGAFLVSVKLKSITFAHSPGSQVCNISNKYFGCLAEEWNILCNYPNNTKARNNCPFSMSVLIIF